MINFQKVGLILMIISSGCVKAMMPIKTVYPSYIVASELGFSFNVEKKSNNYSFNLTGPKVIGDSCYPENSGFILYEGEKEIAVYISKTDSSGEGPSAIGYYSDEGVRAEVFIDYICSDSKEVGGNSRYMFVVGNEEK